MKALVTGAAGQDGTLLCRLLHGDGVQVLGVDRGIRSATGTRDWESVTLDVTDHDAVETLVRDFGPDELYHLAAAHHSSEAPHDARLERAMVATNLGSLHSVLSSVATYAPRCRVLFAGSSQMYTAEDELTVVAEGTPMHPSTFYGHTKAWGRELVAYFRDRHRLNACTVILFNHESELRPLTFATRKIAHAAAHAKHAGSAELQLHDVSARVDWSSARDVVAAMRLALAAPAAKDCVVASGVLHSIRDVLETAFRSVGLDWRRFTTVEKVADRGRGALVGDASAVRRLGWKPRFTFEQMIEEMVRYDLELLRGSTAREIGPGDGVK